MLFNCAVHLHSWLFGSAYAVHYGDRIVPIGLVHRESGGVQAACRCLRPSPAPAGSLSHDDTGTHVHRWSGCTCIHMVV